jgi:hypothetical protein
MSENGALVPTNGNGKRKPNRALRDKLYAETHNWRDSCLRAGYSESVANMGAKYYSKLCPRTGIGITEAVAEQLGVSGLTPKALRDMSIGKLGNAIQTDKPLPTVREIELLGKFKEHDWYVRPESQGDTNIFAVLAQPEMGKMRIVALHGNSCILIFAGRRRGERSLLFLVPTCP